MPEQRMSAQLTKLAKKQGRLPALVTALGLALLLAVQRLLVSLFGWLEVSGVMAIQGPNENAAVTGLYEVNTVPPFDPDLLGLLYFVLPLGLGVFLALWLLAPISHELTVRFVLTRAGLAAASAAFVHLVFGVAVALLAWFGADINTFAPFAAWDGAMLLQNVFRSLMGAIHVSIWATPLVMLAGVLLWLWLRDHPREYEVAGIIDEI